MATRILVIDDDPSTITFVQSILRPEGYRVDGSPLGQPALHKLLHDKPNLVILGINRPDAGWPFCRQLLKLHQGPLFLLLASNREADRVRGLQMGAADCLSKRNYGKIEFVARIHAILRRDPNRGATARPDFFVDGNLEIDLAREQVRLDDRLVSLTPTEFRLLACFLEHIDAILSPRQLAERVWGENQARPRAAIRPHIHYLRQKLEPDPDHPQRIVTCWGKGYLFQRLAVD
ncbi:MAG: response regulator transcription factor [Anaerolineae bacterium]|jgi:DNA-binding response OmpR family regulator